MRTINSDLHDIAMNVCVQICKHRQAYIDAAETHPDPDELYERLCIEHCDECPLNRLGVWDCENTGQGSEGESEVREPWEDETIL